MNKWLLTALLTVLATNVCGDTGIYQLISQGRVGQASDSLAGLPSGALRDGNLLYYAGLIETDAEKAADLMEAALESSVAAIHREQIQYLLSQYYLMADDLLRARQLVGEYLAINESGRYHDEMLRLATVIEELSGEADQAEHHNERYLRLYPKGERHQWGELDRVRLLWQQNQQKKARRQLKSLSSDKQGETIAPALYQLALDALNQGRLEAALRYYDLLREGYPAAIGLDAIEERLVSLPEPGHSGSTAERLTGTRYAVKVGVFSVRANANGRAEAFAGYGYPVNISERDISGTQYHVVLVGNFENYEQASAFKRRAEADFGESFQVVAQ